MSHDLTVKNLIDRISIYESLLKIKRNRTIFDTTLQAMKNGSRMTIRYEKDRD